MSLVEALPAASPMEGLLRHRPALLARYRAFYHSLWQDGLVAHRTLELCRLRIAHIHGSAAEAAVADPQIELDAAAREALRRGDAAAYAAVFADDERTALALAELMPYNPHQISDKLVAAAAAQLGNAGCVALLTALAFFDVSCRLKMVLEVPAQALERSAATLT